MIVLTPTVFFRRGTEGDFAWMIEQPRWHNTLFVFNDNERQSEAFLAQAASGSLGLSSSACQAGGGNAVIRPYQCRRPPRAAGVPTGPGYMRLTDYTKRRVDTAIEYIGGLLASNLEITELIYSASKNAANVLGHGIFDVGEDVLEYIPAELRRVVEMSNQR